MSLLGSWFSYLVALIRTRVIVLNDDAFSLHKIQSIIRAPVCRGFGLRIHVSIFPESSWYTNQELNNLYKQHQNGTHPLWIRCFFPITTLEHTTINRALMASTHTTRLPKFPAFGAFLLTAVFWHWMEVLLKRRAGTLWVSPWMWKTHS